MTTPTNSERIVAMFIICALTFFLTFTVTKAQGCKLLWHLVHTASDSVFVLERCR